MKEEAVCSSCKKKKCGCEVNEALSPKQEKIAKLAGDPKKIDAQDLKKLRKEEQEPPFDKPYTTVKNTKDNGAQKARALAQKALKTAIIQGHERFTSTPDKLKKQHFGMSEDYTEEEVDSMISEVLSKDAKAGDWISDFMKSDNPKFAGKSKEKRKQMALAAYYSKQRNEEVEQIDELSKTTLGSYIKKAKSSAIGSANAMGMTSDTSKVHKKAETKLVKRASGINKAVDRLTSEEVELHEGNHREFASQGKMHPDMAKHMTVGNEMDFYAHGTGDKMSGKVMKNDGKEVHIKTTLNPYKEKDSSVHKFKVASKLEESSHPVAPYVKTQNYSWGKMKTIHHGSDFSIPLHPEHHEAIAKLKDEQEHHFKTEDGKHWTARRKGNDVHFQGANGGNSTTVSHSSMREEKEESMITFKDFITEMEFVNGKYVHKGNYGTAYDDPEGKEDGEKKPAEKAEKRGRGRPAGAKSGARQIGGASKKGSGVEYTGYKLHLPNSNK
jgi:hypothetical protein